MKMYILVKYGYSNAAIHPFFFGFAHKFKLFRFSLKEMVGVFLSPQASLHRA